MGQLITSAPMRLVFWLCGATILVMRGYYSEADIIQASVSQDVIDAE